MNIESYLPKSSVTNDLKLNNKVKVTLLKKGDFHWLIEGTVTKFKVSYKNRLGFHLSNQHHRSLMHLNEWETDYGIFEIDRGLVVKIEKVTPLITRILNYIL